MKAVANVMHRPFAPTHIDAPVHCSKSGLFETRFVPVGRTGRKIVCCVCAQQTNCGRSNGELCMAGKTFAIYEKAPVLVPKASA